MSDTHYGKDSIARLGTLKTLNRELFDAFNGFDAKVFAPGSLDLKTKELLAVACAHITRCPYCIDAHTARALKAGATPEELAEAIFVATAMSAGAALAHSCIAMETVIASGHAGHRASAQEKGN
jgi:AhpD family alkylhydroperoxidase